MNTRHDLHLQNKNGGGFTTQTSIVLAKGSASSHSQSAKEEFSQISPRFPSTDGTHIPSPQNIDTKDNIQETNQMCVSEIAGPGFYCPAAGVGFANQHFQIYDHPINKQEIGACKSSTD